MSQRISGVLSLVLFFLVAEAFPVQAQSTDAKALLDEAAKAMGGTQALRSLKNEVVESEGKQFEHAQAKRPGGPGRQTTEFRYTATRDLSQPRLRLEWDARILYPRDDSLRYVEIIDGSIGLLQEGGVWRRRQAKPFAPGAPGISAPRGEARSGEDYPCRFGTKKLEAASRCGAGWKQLSGFSVPRERR